MKFERESINLHDTKLFGVLRPEVIPDGVFFYPISYSFSELLAMGNVK